MICLTLEGIKNGTPPPPSIFKRIQPIDVKLGMCNKCLVYSNSNRQIENVKACSSV